MRRIMVVFGTRPEAIKMCPLVLELQRTAGIECIVCVTGQHRQMLNQVLDAFDITPDYNLEVMAEGQTLFDITSKVLNGMRDIMDATKPDAVLVHGDTTTSFAAALAGFYCDIPVGHVEAGLRTHNLRSPFPEEFNRQAVDIVSSWWFAPTGKSRDNLLAEGKPAECIYVTGNTGIDALNTTVKASFTHPLLDWAGESRLILITAHRRENLGEPMHAMFRAIRRIVDAHPGVKAVYPVHLNPAVREAASDELEGHSRILLTEPLDMIDFHNLLARCHIVLTDSGGIQEEAPSLGKPVLVMRDTTERPEGVEAGTLKLVGTDEDVIASECAGLLDNDEEYLKMSHAFNPYGDGHASERIVAALMDTLDQ